MQGNVYNLADLLLSCGVEILLVSGVFILVASVESVELS